MDHRPGRVVTSPRSTHHEATFSSPRFGNCVIAIIKKITSTRRHALREPMHYRSTSPAPEKSGRRRRHLSAIRLDPRDQPRAAQSLEPFADLGFKHLRDRLVVATSSQAAPSVAPFARRSSNAWRAARSRRTGGHRASNTATHLASGSAAELLARLDLARRSSAGYASETRWSDGCSSSRSRPALSGSVASMLTSEEARRARRTQNRRRAHSMRGADGQQAIFA